MTELMPSLCNDCVARNQCGNDDVKMCISYTKETKIKCDDCKFVENCVDYGWDGCRKFTQKPSESNEEYIRAMSDEDLAIWIYQERCKYSDGWYEQCGHTVEEVKEWLKEIHK